MASTTYTLNSKTVNSILVHSTPLSSSDLAKINNNPNLIGKLALETLGATKTIPELDMVMDAGTSADSYYMCSEKSGAYLVDSRVAYGTENVANGDFATTSLTNWSFINATGTVISGELEVTATSTAAQSFYTMTTVVGKIYKVSFDARLGTATGLNYSVYDIANLQEIITPTPYDAKDDISFLFKATGTSTRVYTTRNITTIGTAYFDNVSVREATATEIANYASTVRTNADLQQKGIQTTAFVADGAGVPTAYSSNLLQFNGDGRYVDTGFMPPSDSTWEIDFVIECIADGTIKMNGRYNNDVNDIMIGQHSLHGLYGKCGTTTIGNASIPVADGLHYVRFEYNGVGGGNFVVDNIATYPFSTATYSYLGTASFYIGRPSVSSLYKMVKPSGEFQYKLGTRTASERNAYYAKLKAIYPTLP